MSTPFWTNYDNTRELCLAGTDLALDSFAMAHPEDFGGGVAFTDITEDNNLGLYQGAGFGGDSFLAPGGTVIQNPVVVDPAPTSANVFFDSSVASIGTPTAGTVADWDPDHVDYFITADPTDTISISAGTPVQATAASLPGTMPVTMTLSDQGGGVWRIRLTGFSGLTWGYVENAGEFNGAVVFGTIADAEAEYTVGGVGDSGNDAVRTLQFTVDVTQNSESPVTYTFGFGQTAVA